MARAIEEPQNARSRRTSAALLTAARDIIESQGFNGLTMAAVADRAGVSRRAVYLHFTSRTQLLTALYRSLGETENLAESLQAVWDAPDGVAALDEWARHVARAHPRILAILRAVQQAQATDPDAAELWQTTKRNWHMGSKRVIARLVEEGRLAPEWTASNAADMVWALMSTDLLDGLLTDRHWSGKRVGEQLSVVLRRTFVSAGEPRSTMSVPVDSLKP